MVLSSILSWIPISDVRKVQIMNRMSSRTHLPNRNLLIISSEMMPYYHNFCQHLLPSTDIRYVEKNNLYNLVFNKLDNYQWDNIGIVFDCKYNEKNNTNQIISRTMSANIDIIEEDPTYQEAMLLLGKLKMHTRNNIHIFSNFEKMDAVQYILKQVDLMFHFDDGISVSSNHSNWKMNWNTKKGYLNESEAQISPILSYMSRYVNVKAIKN